MDGKKLIVGDPALARRLERAEAEDLRAYAEAWRIVAPEQEVAVEEAGGGVLAFTGPESPITQAVGLGMDGPVTAEEFELLEEFFFSRGARAAVAVCPLADPAFVAELARRGFRLDEFEDVLVARPSEIAGTPRASGDVSVRLVQSHESREWAELVARGFTGSEGPEPQHVLTGLALLARPEATAFVAEIEGVPVAGAALTVRGSTGSLLAAATLTEYRGRGAQTALTERLLQEAAGRGCDLVAAGGAPGSTSHRNQERAGLRVAYTKVMLVKDPPRRN